MKTENKKLTAEELKKLRDVDFSKEPGFETAETMLAREVGEVGSPEREEFDAKAKAWYYGEVLRDRRKALGITQKELAERIGRDRTYISRLEKGETDLQLSSFLRIADALDMTLRLETLKTAVGEGIDSGIAKDFDPELHLKSLKESRNNG